ncbi:MAG: polysaccharide biosynthesis protein PslH [Solirubrobacteraceae bacterium]|jgi:glycosyltransferase involved in cell wall biosynthesis|nr:polysaccharide biosynthesis protein PslH [Solirubrobacteraceae bacterium]
MTPDRPPARGDRLLFVARRPPFPLANGARIRSHRLLTGLAEVFDTTLLTFEHERSSAEGHMARDELEDMLPGVRVQTVPGRRIPKRTGQLRSLGTRSSWEFGRYSSDRLRRAVADAVAEGAALVHFDDLGVALAGPAAGAVSVYSAHNVEQRIMEGTIASAQGVRRAFAEAELRKIRREEQRAWSSISLCLAVSELDARVMRAGGARVEVCPNGADPVEALPFASRPPGAALRILFVGSVDYGPNYTGIAWFVDEVLPRLRETAPATLDVVGFQRRPLPMLEGVTYHGQVPSVRPFYERAHVAIAPVPFGSGTRLKIVEAMALGRPVVSTHVGAEGLPVRPGIDYLAADDAEGFARALAQIAAQTAGRDADRLHAMLHRARRAVSDLAWPEIVDRLAALYRSELHAAGRAAEAPRALAG